MRPKDGCLKRAEARQKTTVPGGDGAENESADDAVAVAQAQVDSDGLADRAAQIRLVTRPEDPASPLSRDGRGVPHLLGRASRRRRCWVDTLFVDQIIDHARPTLAQLATSLLHTFPQRV